MAVDGIGTVVSVLSGRVSNAWIVNYDLLLESLDLKVNYSDMQVNFQIQYQLTFCLWVTSFSIPLATKLNK